MTLWHSLKGGDPLGIFKNKNKWIPVYTGMTDYIDLFLRLKITIPN